VESSLLDRLIDMAKGNRTPQWVKKLSGHAGELYVAAELSKRGIPNALLPENFSDDDLMVGGKDGGHICFVQVKSCHPDRSDSFILHQDNESWAANNQPHRLVVFVFLGSPRKNEPPSYWIATRSEVGEACRSHPAHGTKNWERRFWMEVNKWGEGAALPAVWRNRWTLFSPYMPGDNGGNKPETKVKTVRLRANPNLTSSTN
jgi:hypothetical protein